MNLNATASVTLGQTISNSATLIDGNNPTGHIFFSLYGPNDTNCLGTAAFISAPKTVVGSTATSDSYSLVAAGTYRWVASYPGDSNNVGSTTPCNATNSTSVVSPATPAISPAATATATVGQDISNTATLSSLVTDVTPTGTISFNLYGPDDATCSGTAAFASGPKSISSNAAASGNFPASAAGTYRWIAIYSGDANYNGVSSTCGSSNSVITSPVKANPSISSSATATAFLGQTISDTATLASGNAATGTVTFNLYGPTDASCTGTPIFTDSASVTGGTTATSATFSPTIAGTYRWVASYAGDTNNNGVAGLCSDAGATSVVFDPLNISPNPLAFGDQNILSSSDAKAITVSNEGTSAITISSVVATGDADFTISFTTCPTSPATLAAGSSCEVNVVFQPAALGARSAIVTITSNVGVDTIDVTGTGKWAGAGSTDLWTLLILSAFLMWRLIKREQTL